MNRSFFVKGLMILCGEMSWNMKSGSGKCEAHPSLYESRVKPILDKTLALLALFFLCPLYMAIALMIYLDDPGPVIFTQKRVGKDGRFFMLHKFRTMKLLAPHDVPTHQLKHPEKYITNIGKTLRRASLDELPQIWDILRGKMSVIGPRPALWNQDDLVAERERYGANGILPGLTGLAQIHGRDELEIAQKAKVDGRYARVLKLGGVKAFAQDVRCFAMTVWSVLRHNGVVEGSASGLKKDLKSNRVKTGSERQKKILIVGENSYIGEQVKRYLAHASSKFYMVDTIDAIGLEPDTGMFLGYDVVFHIAGIAHVKETNRNRALYYEVNRDLAVRVAKVAKKAGVHQFILLSTMSVYGIDTGKITKDTVPYPATAYGESKLAADEAVWELSDANFGVAILRPPMVYGKGCKGNYQSLRKFVLQSPIFPSYENERSMVYIGNLCEFVKRVIDEDSTGLFFPQNAEYVSTLEMAWYIARWNGKRLKAVPFFNSEIRIASWSAVKKAFGSLTYEKEDLVGKYSFSKSMELTEGHPERRKIGK